MENIIPAIQQMNEKSLKELSPQEFQQLLSSWFQDRGIIQDMKSYLKFQMINVLKNTTIGKNMTKCVPQTYSLAQQALHLIVAEYLLQNHCHFTFSLFINEVSLTNILPNDKAFFCNDDTYKTTRNVFDKDNLINILELTGLPKDNEHFARILNCYFEGGVCSLLSCLIDVIGKGIKESSVIDVEDKAGTDFDDDFMGNVSQILESLNLPQKTRNRLLHSIKLCYDVKNRAFENQCIKLINKFKKEIHIRDKRIHDADRQKRLLEKQVLKLQRENDSVNEKLHSLLKESKVVQHQQIIPSVCSLNHCDDKCKEANKLYEIYKKEIELLRIDNTKQKEEIQKLDFNCNELLKEFNCCQSKINLVNTKIQEDIYHEVNSLSAACHDNNTQLGPDSDTTITEEILQQAREKLKLLEEESKELDIRFSNFVIK